jgi:hypothetical protein
MSRLSVVEQEQSNQENYDEQEPVRCARRGDVPAKTYHNRADRRRARVSVTATIAYGGRSGRDLPTTDSGSGAPNFSASAARAKAWALKF